MTATKDKVKNWHVRFLPEVETDPQHDYTRAGDLIAYVFKRLQPLETHSKVFNRAGLVDVADAKKVVGECETFFNLNPEIHEMLVTKVIDDYSGLTLRLRIWKDKK